MLTVSRQLSIDRFNLEKEKFLEFYGHLRPGTYDILSPRYDEKPEIYFDWEDKANFSKIKKFKPNHRQLDRISKLAYIIEGTN